MNQGLRGVGAIEDVDEDSPPQYGRVVGDDDDDDFPLWEGSSPGGIARMWAEEGTTPYFFSRSK